MTYRPMKESINDMFQDMSVFFVGYLAILFGGLD